MKATIVTVGYVVTLNGLFWGKSYSGGGHGDGDCFGWVEFPHAHICKPAFTDPAYLTYPNSPYAEELRRGKVVKVKRIVTTEIEVSEEESPCVNRPL